MKEQNELDGSRQAWTAADSEQAASSLIAPWWHTALLILVLLSASFLSTRKGHQPSSVHHVLEYLLTLGWEWVLALLVLWGIHLRRVSLRDLLGVRRPNFHGWRDDFIAAIVFWFASSIVLTAVGLAFKLGHVSTPQKELAALAPGNTGELVLWVLLSLSAGICEELLFRGYLLRQFLGAARHVWIAIVLSSVLFGVAHGYEGISGMVAISLYGALFAMLAIKRRSLRAGMMAHAWHDIFSGVALMALKHSGAL